MPRAEQLTDPELDHGEGPQWFAEFGTWRCVDMLRGDVVGLDASGRIVRNNIGSVAAMIRPRTLGGAVILREHDVVTVGGDPLQARDFRQVAQLLNDPLVRMNEGACDPVGRLVCGSMAYDMHEGGASVYRITMGDHGDAARVETLREAVTISNGIAFTADGSVAYYVDTSTSRIEMIDYSGGSFSSASTLIDLHDESGAPDGLCIDDEGNLWVAMFGGGCVLAISPTGVIVERIELPTTQVTACAFAGDDLDELIITTSTLHIPGGRVSQPLAGAIFTYWPGRRGAPVLAFGR